MLGNPQPSRPIGPRRPTALSGLAAALLLAGLAGCGGAEPTVTPDPPPETIQKAPPPAPAPNPPSTFSIVVDEAKRRQELIDRLKRVLNESEP